MKSGLGIGFRPCFIGTSVSMMLLYPGLSFVNIRDIHGRRKNIHEMEGDRFRSIGANFGDSGIFNRKSSIPLYSPKSDSQK